MEESPEMEDEPLAAPSPPPSIGAEPDIPQWDELPPPSSEPPAVSAADDPNPAGSPDVPAVEPAAAEPAIAGGDEEMGEEQEAEEIAVGESAPPAASAVDSPEAPAPESETAATIAGDDEEMGEEEMAVDEEAEEEEEEEPKSVMPRRGVRKKKRGRPRVVAQRQRPRAPARMKKEEEGLCFICFDGGDLVVCDHKGCPKVYHPECVNRDEAYFQAKGQWSCGWHICSICEKSATYKCYTCTYSLCRGCIKESNISLVRGNKGLCEACMKMIMLIEKNVDANGKMVDIDFDDRNSWEYLFKDYWIELKAKLSLTLEELTNDRTLSKPSSAVCDNEESSEDPDDAHDDQGSSSQSSSGCREKNSSSGKLKRRPRKTASKEALSKEMTDEDASTPGETGEALRERKVNKRSRRGAAKEGSVTGVENSSTPEDTQWVSKERKVKRRLRKIADREGTGKEVVVEGASITEEIQWASKELLAFVAHMKDGDRSVLSQIEVQTLILGYIKQNKLRDRRRKSEIICDSRLRSLFGKSHVGHIEMLNLLEKHFLIKETSPVITDDNQGGVVDPDPSLMDAEGISDASTRMTPEKRRKSYRRVEVKGQTNLSDYAAIDVHNVNLMYLRRNLMENLLDDIEMFNEKVIGSFVRIRVSALGQRHDVYRLVQVVGIGKAADKYKTGRRTTDITLEILNLDKREVITIDIISNQAFTEEECKRLRQSIKCGFICRLTVGEVQEKARVLQAVRVNDWLDSEKSRLGHLRDRASEKGHRKELRECVEKLQLLNTPEEQMRKLNEVPEIHADSNMDPDYESAEDDGDSDDKRQDNYSSSREYSFKGREIISPGTGGSVSGNNWSATPGESKITWESNRSVSRGGQDVESSTAVAVSVSELSHNQGKGVYQTSSHESKTDVSVTDLGAGVQSAGGPTKTTPESLLVNAAGPSGTSETEKIWHYQDPSGKIQGPFSMTQLRKWNTTGYFPANLRIWRVSEKQEDSILLTDALVGKFHKELQQEPQYSNTLQPIKGGTVVGNNRDVGRRGSNSNSNPAGTDGQQSGENWKAGRIDSRLGSFITPQSSSLSGNQVGMAYPAEGIPAASLRGYQSSNDLNASSGQLQGYNNQRPTPFSGNTYQPPSYQSREDRGVNNGGWNQSQVCQNTCNSDQPRGLQPGGQGVERQHQDWSSSRKQFPGQHWQGQLASGFSNQSGSDSFHTSNPTPQTRSRNETSYHSILNSISPSAQPMHSGWGTAPSGTQAQQSLTAAKLDDQQNSLSVGGAPVILANQQIADELLHKDGPLNGAAVLGSSSAIGFASGSDNQSLGSDLASKHELTPTADSNSEFSQPVHSHSNERGGDPGLHDGSASQTKIIGIDGGRSDPAAFSTVPSGISDLPVSAFTEGDSLKLRCSASDEAAVDTKLMVQSDASESVSAQNQDPNGSNVNSGAAEKISEQIRSEEKQPSSTSLAPSTSSDCKLPSGMNTVQLSKASLSSNARVSGGEPAASFTSTNSQMGQSVTCDPSPSNALNASASTEAVQSSNIGCGTVANDVQNPGLAVAPQNSNPGPGGVQQGFGNMPYGTAMQGSPNMGWGMVGQGNTNMAWGTPANLNMGWGPLAQPNTNANTGFGLLPQGNPNMNMAWGATAQGNINPNAGWGAAMMQGNATLNPGWVAPVQGNVNTSAGWMVPTPGNADQTASWGAPVQGNVTPTPGWAIPAQTTANPNPGWVAPTTGNTNQNASWGSPMQGTGQGMAWDQSSGNCNGWNAQQQQSGSGHFSPGHGSGRKSGNRMQRSGGGGGPSRPPSRGQRGVCRWFQENGYCKKGANCEYIHPEPTER